MMTSMLGRVVFGKALVLGLAAALSMGLVGCNKSQKQADLATQESAELRERVASLEQQVRDKDARIAELETRPAGNVTGYDTGAPTGRRTYNEPSSFQRGDDGRMTAEVKGDVLFASGQATVRPEARKELDRIAADIKRQYGGASIRVEGHTDSDPIKKSKWGSNDELSQARADAVREYLIKKGISAGRIESMGYGSSKPKGTKAASRRVDIVIMN